MAKFGDLPNELILNILSYLSWRELGITAQISRRFNMLSDDPVLWNPLLRSGFRDTTPGAAKKVFLTNPAARMYCIGFDKPGRRYLDQVVQDVIMQRDLSEIQLCHLRSVAFKKELYKVNNSQDTVTVINDAILNSSPEQTQELNTQQLAGIRAGLVREQVAFDWFSEGHVLCARREQPYVKYTGLTNDQAFVVADGRTREQAITLSNDALQSAQLGTDYASFFGACGAWNLRGQGPSPWVSGLGIFQSCAVVTANIPQAVVKDLNKAQVRGVLAGLTREQVYHAWFTLTHALAAESGIPYVAYERLSEDQVWAVVNGANCEETKGWPFSLRWI